MTKTLSLALIALFASFTSSAASAAPTTSTRQASVWNISANTELANGYVGALAGPVMFKRDIGTKFGIGFQAGYKFTKLIGAGFFYETASMTNAQIGSSGRAHVIAGEFLFFPLSNMGLQVGAKVGVATSSGGGNAGEVNAGDFDFGGFSRIGGNAIDLGLGNNNAAQGQPSNTNFIFGPSIGYHLVVHRNWAVGTDVSYLMSTTANEMTTALNILAGASFVF